MRSRWRDARVTAAARMVLALLLVGPAGVPRAAAIDEPVAPGLQRGRPDTVGTADPRWIGGSDRFWYRAAFADGTTRYYVVDPEARTQRVAFDHVRLAAALTKVLGRPVEADRLPVMAIDFEDGGKTLAIRVESTGCAVDLANYSLREIPITESTIEALPPDTPPGGETGRETSLTFINRTAEPVSLVWLAYTASRRDYGRVEANGARTLHTFAGHTWLVARTDGTPLAVYIARPTPETVVIHDLTPVPPRPAPRDPALSPDGKWRAIVQDHNVFLTAADGSGRRPLSADGSAGDSYGDAAVWSPDSSRFVMMKTIPAQEHTVYEVESSPSDQVQPKLHSFDYLKPGDRIAHPRPVLFDARTGRETPVDEALFPNPWEISEVRWEPDSRRFTFLYNQRGHQVFRLIAVDAATGRASVIIDERSKTFIDWTNKIYFHPLDATHEAIWMSERDGWNHLYLYDTQIGAVKNRITTGEWVVRGVTRIDDANRQVWFTAGGLRPGQDPYYIHECRVNFDGSGLTVLTHGDGTHTTSWSRDRRYFVDTWSRVDAPPISVLRSSADGSLVMPLQCGDAAALAAHGWRCPERFVAKGRDGVTAIYGVIYRPAHFDPARKYPIVESIYAGPQGAFVPKPFRMRYPLLDLADLGFVVVQIDGMGTNFRSRAFHDVCWKNLSDAGVPDRILWIKAAAAKYPYMDLSRVGIFGTSAGGQNALSALLLHGDFYKVGVADCGCHDNRMDKIWWNEQWMGWPVDASYAANSNVTLAPRLRGKLFLMVGELDTNVDPASTMQVVNALIKAGKDFDLLVMPGSDHGVAGSPYGQRRLREFLVRNLLEVGPPDRSASQTSARADRIGAGS